MALYPLKMSSYYHVKLSLGTLSHHHTGAESLLIFMISSSKRTNSDKQATINMMKILQERFKIQNSAREMTEDGDSYMNVILQLSTW